YFSLEKYYRNTTRQFVIVIDEWDAVFRIRKEDHTGQRKYLDFLRDWMKDKTYIALAYMTGILPIKKYGEHSTLNMFTEYSMESPRQLATYTGFTEKEVKELCTLYGMDYTDISDWYDGYVISDRIPPEKRDDYRQGIYDGHKVSIYSPLSVVESMITGQISNYWNKT
ncbi:MAG: AAA family ATPase, partial [Blautia sp.]|nr:AAA family ATPase [Blautia sp.]